MARVHAALLGVQIAFATLSVAGRVLVRELDPMALALLRLGGAALVFVALDLARRRSGPVTPMIAQDRLAIAGCAALGIFGNQALFLTGLRYTTATHATLLVATIPVFTALVGVALHRAAPRWGLGEPARAQVLVGIAVALGGVAYLVLPDALAGASGTAWLGDALVTANSLVYAIYLVLVRRYAARYGSIAVVAWGFTCGAAMALPLGGPALLEDAPSLGAASWALVVYVVLVATVFTYLANAWALRFAPSALVATYIFVQPIVASVLAWIFLDEVPSMRLGGAALLVAAGVVLVIRTPARATVTAPTR
jgi:drug/metabolite transporter (DMT)-like permease